MAGWDGWWAWTMVPSLPASSPDGAQFWVRTDARGYSTGYGTVGWDGMGWDCADY